MKRSGVNILKIEQLVATPCQPIDYCITNHIDMKVTWQFYGASIGSFILIIRGKKIQEEYIDRNNASTEQSVVYLTFIYKCSKHV